MQLPRHADLHARIIAGRVSRAVLLCALLLIAAAPGRAQPPIKQILMLQSLDRGNINLDDFTGIFRVSLDQRAGRGVNVVQLVVGPIGFVGASEQSLVDYIRSVYGDRPPDLVMTVGGPASVFARKHYRQLFPAMPLLLAAVDQRYVALAPLAEHETAVSVVNDLPRLLDDILHILPATRQVFMINGSGTIGQFWRRQLEPEFVRYAGRLTFTWFDDLTLQNVLRRVSALPKDSVIVYIAFSTDVQGGAYADEQVLADLRREANAPMFATNSSLLGHGVVGGSMIRIDDLARGTAEVANRMLNGAPPGSIRLPARLPGSPMFDWRELQRWGIGESRLPPNSEVRYRGPTLWDQYWLAILASIGVLLLQSLLIARLLYEIRARHRAESDSRRNLGIAADANRRETMSALTASMGHELAQPLSAVRLNAAALQKMVASDTVTREETQEILADIQSGADLAIHIFDRHRAMMRGRQLEKKPVDLRNVIDESLALVSRDMTERQIRVTLALSPGPCVIEGDQVLLQQVFLNLVRNAMDALAEAPPSRRQIAIGSAVRATDVEITVSDTGPGLPPEIIGTLYKPFVTTKANGLGIGLTIAHSIVTAHGGNIIAARKPEGGAIFTVKLPLGKVHA